VAADAAAASSPNAAAQRRPKGATEVRGVAALDRARSVPILMVCWGEPVFGRWSTIEVGKVPLPSQGSLPANKKESYRVRRSFFLSPSSNSAKEVRWASLADDNTTWILFQQHSNLEMEWQNILESKSILRFSITNIPMATTPNGSGRALLFAGQGTDVSASVKKLINGPRGSDAR
jgi:hypothetical protein